MFNGYKKDIAAAAPKLEELQEGFPTEGSPALGIPATQPGAAWFHMITTELINAVKELGVTPDKSTLNQLATAILSLKFPTGTAFEYLRDKNYSKNDIVLTNERLYLCMANNGPASSVVEPGTNDAVWQKIPTTSDVSALIPIATTLIKGIVQLCDNIDANATDNSKALTPYAVARQNYVKSVNSVRADAYGNVSITRVDSAASADTADNANHATNADHATASDTADNAGILTGFANHEDGLGWGVQIGTPIMSMNDSTGGSVGFRRDCPSTRKTSMIIDGYVYQNEGLYQVIDTNTIGSQSVNYATYSSRSANNGSFFINGYEVSVG